MPLFPAYSDAPADGAEMHLIADEPGGKFQCAELDFKEEAALLASDDSNEEPPTTSISDPVPSLDVVQGSVDYYLDYKLDCGNLRVSTLYYPGRPQYNTDGAVIGGKVWGAGRRGKRKRRYYERALAATDEGGGELAQRAADWQRALRDAPDDEPLWLRLIQLQEQAGAASGAGAGAALAACRAARARLPCSAALRRAELRLSRAVEPAHRHLANIRDMLAQETSSWARRELWTRLLQDGAADAGAARRVALAALRDRDHAARDPHATLYAEIIFHYGSFLRCGGLSEQLVQLLELLCSVSLSPVQFTPSSETYALWERQLQEQEDKMARSGLPLSAVWARVERARAQAQWRAPPPASLAPDELALDPARAPLAADAAELLQPLVRPTQLAVLAVHVLRLCGVPLIPGAGYVLRALHGGAAGAAAAARWGAGGAGGAEALLALQWARRRSPPPAAPRASPAGLTHLVALLADPPHYFTDHYGYLSWTCSVWDAACAWAAGGAGCAARDALLCWRLRWHAALLMCAQSGAEGAGGCGAETARVRRVARELVRAAAAGSGDDVTGALVCAEFARLEALACGAARGRRVALAALGQALREPGPAAQHAALYIARVVCELCEPAGAGAGAGEGRAALCRAVLRDAPAAGDSAEPPRALLDRAREKCEAMCAEVEERLEREAGAAVAEGDAAAAAEGGAVAALLPGAGEWGAARAMLATPARRRDLFAQLIRDKHWATRGGEPARYHEECSEALCAGGAGGAAGEEGVARLAWARELSALHPHNAALAEQSARAPLWAGAGVASDVGAPPGGAAGGVGSSERALAAALPHLTDMLQHTDSTSVNTGAERAARVLRRAGGEGCGALLWEARLQAEARAGVGGTGGAGDPLVRTLYRAIDDMPCAKWVAVTGAALRPAECAALTDALLERQLRVRAAPQEFAE